MTIRLAFLMWGILGMLQASDWSSWPVSGRGALSVAFADSLTGWAAGSVKTGGVVRDSAKSGDRTYYRTMILKTTNGGVQWNLQTVIQTGEEVVQVVDIQATDASHAWLLLSQPDMDRDFLLRTINGKDWTALPIAIESKPKRMTFVDQNTGFLIANEFMAEDRMFKTTDGGQSWMDHPIGFSGIFHDMKFSGTTGYVLANLNNTSSTVTLLKSHDGGGIWIVGHESQAESGRGLEGIGLILDGRHMIALLREWDEDSDDAPRTLLVHSEDGLVSQTTNRVTYDTDRKSAYSIVKIADYAGAELVGIDESPAPDESRTVYVIGSTDHGATWKLVGTLPGPLTSLHEVKDQVLVGSTSDGEMTLSTNGGSSWMAGEINFRGLFLKATARKTDADSSPIAFSDEMDSEETDRDTVYASRWESEADSLLAVKATRSVDVNRYLVNKAVDFSVGIDSIYTSQIVFHKRVRRGAKHQVLDLIRQETQRGEIRLRKYKTLRLVGTVRAVNGKWPVRYSWSSSINGELSDQLAFTTTPKQLYPGTHFIFFKAMDGSGQWSEPIVTKVIIEDFPKFKFPFYGTWTVGGGGSYYNQGRHVRGIRYALDLNLAEGQDGGDSDYGVPVRASTDGVVAFAGYVRGYGRTVKVDHLYGGKKYTTLVTHLATISVEVGEHVRQGQEVGTCGTTGRSSAPHVHWELRVDDVCVEPEPVFANDSTVIQAIRNGSSFTSDNYFQPEHIVVVDEPSLGNTYLEHRGYNHTYRWANVTKNVATVECVWRPDLKRSAKYRIQVHIPKKFATATATYRVHSKKGAVEIKVNQNKHTDEWVNLGTFDFEAGDDVYVETNNATGQARKTIALDAVRFIGLWNEHPEVGFESIPK